MKKKKLSRSVLVANALAWIANEVFNFIFGGKNNLLNFVSTILIKTAILTFWFHRFVEFF